MEQIGFLRDAAEIAHAHHGRYDGKGYLRGLKGNEIPLGAWLFMVADVYDALTSQRPCRSPMTCEQARAEIAGEDGGHFDPLVLATFLTIAPEKLQQIAAAISNTCSHPIFADGMPSG